MPKKNNKKNKKSIIEETTVQPDVVSSSITETISVNTNNNFEQNINNHLEFLMDNNFANFILKGKGGKIRFNTHNNCSCHGNDEK